MTSLDQQPNLSLSEDDDPTNDPASSKQPALKRGTRACDRCRKIKSKCEAGTGTDDKCKNCEIANTPCTFQGPNFKRGPPKGYIHSIEQRWHQVECILATIMESPRAQDIINDLRGDPFANAILDRVHGGPYGSRNRLQQRQDPTSESFYTSLLEVPDYTPMREDRRSRRQSRVSREIVSQDPTALATPTREWQDQLARRLTQGNQLAYTTSPISPASRSSSSAGGSGVEYSRTRRRIDWPIPSPLQQNWHNLYTIPDAAQAGHETSHVDETAEAFGHLSMDQNKEFRYHGPASGLPLLAQSHRKSGDDKQENRIWKFTANVDPESAPYDLIAEEEDVEVHMPVPEMRNHLLQLYFTYVHPFFPVIHKQDFLQKYSALETPSAPTSLASRATMSCHPMQRPCKIVLLAMFAIAARYSNRPEVHIAYDNGSGSRAGQQYVEDAHKLLVRKYQSGRPSTCQALLLLAIREFGMGAMDKGWLYSGMALRMAIDLGMNRNADNWTTDGKQSVFTDTEKQIRKHIWWSCCISDKLSAVWLGRPITFRANDYSTPIPAMDEADENEPWQPYPPETIGEVLLQSSKTMSCFREACHLSVIITDIMDKIYPVQSSSDTPRRVLFDQLEARLNKWLIELPEHLRFSANDRRATVLPHVLVLHIEYHAAVLLLHRAFLPPDNDHRRPQANLQIDPLALKAFDVCSGAASQICSMAEIYNERFGLEKAPPFLCIYLQSAGIMHVITLSRRPWDPQASIGLTRCIAACKQIEKLWPTATRLRTLLEGAKVSLDESIYSLDTGQASSRKRSVEDALGSSKNPDVAAHDTYGMPVVDSLAGSPTTSTAWDHAHSARMVAHTLGLGGPGSETSTSFYPGYQWWPSQLLTTEGLTHTALSAPMDLPSVSASMSYSAMPGYAHSPQHVPHSAPQHPHQTPHAPSHDSFTFGQGNLSQNFVQNVNYPEFNFSRYQQHPSDPRHEPRQ